MSDQQDHATKVLNQMDIGVSRDCNTCKNILISMQNIRLHIANHRQTKKNKLRVHTTYIARTETNERLPIRDSRQCDNLLSDIACYILLFNDPAKTFYIHLHYNFCRVVVCRTSPVACWQTYQS